MRYSAAQSKPLAKSGPPAADTDKMRWNGSLKKPLALQKSKSEPGSPVSTSSTSTSSSSSSTTTPTTTKTEASSSVPPKTSYSNSSSPLPQLKSKPSSALGPGLKLQKWPGHEVHKNLYVGDLSCALDLTQLRSRNITHVLTATNRMKPMFPDDLHYLVLDFPDSADQNLLDAFDAAHAFISEAHEAGGAVLIHCMAGQSRSVTVALSYIMKKEGVSDQEALAAFRAIRSDAKPINAFQEQLALFKEMEYRVDDAHPTVQKLRKSCSKIKISRSKPS